MTHAEQQRQILLAQLLDRADLIRRIDENHAAALQQAERRLGG
jgi:hypothetical protein